MSTGTSTATEHASIGTTNMTISVQPGTEIWIEYDGGFFDNVTLGIKQVHFITPLSFKGKIRLPDRMAKYRCVLRPAKYENLTASSYPKVVTDKLRKAIHAAIRRTQNHGQRRYSKSLKFGANGVTATYKKRTYCCEVNEIE